MGEIHVNTLSIGVDIGTTNTKAVLFDNSGQVLIHEQYSYPLITTDADTAEQHPQSILEAVEFVLMKVIQASKQWGELSHIAFSAQMHSLILVDEHMVPLTNSITWADNRAKYCAEKLKHNQMGDLIYRNTGTPIHAMSPLCKLLWFKETQPDLLKATHKVIDIKTFVLYHLSGQCVTDMSIASATGLFNIHKKYWDDTALNLVELALHQLPQVVSTTYCLSMSENAKNRFHLHKQVPMVVGASDGVLSNLGVDSMRPGEIAVTIGTSGAIRSVVHEPLIDPEGRTFCYILDDSHYVIGGPVNNGAVTLQWLGEQVLHYPHHSEDPIDFEEMMHRAKSVPIGSDGLIFHPYLSGERAPLWSSDAKGSFIGLTLAHHQGHVIRAVMEGVIFNLYSVMTTLTQISNITPTSIKATGGFSKNELWRQIMADIFNCQVIVPEDYESSCLGAVILGKKALGHLNDYEEISSWIGKTICHEPIKGHVQQYKVLGSIFLDIQKQLLTTYKHIAVYQQQFKNQTDERDHNDL